MAAGKPPRAAAAAKGSSTVAAASQTATAAPATPDASRPAPGDEWVLVWSDEFEGDALDPAKWDCEIGNGFFDYRSHTWIPGWGNEELQYYTRDPANVQVRDSLLTLRAVRESLHGCGYTSARVATRRRDGAPLFAKCYGRFEFRARVPHGRGLWPALWMLPLENRYGGWAASGEIDVMEIVGERPQEVLGSIHFGSRFPRRHLVTHVYPFPDGGTVDDFHVYAVEWTPGSIAWLVDGVEHARQQFWWSSPREGRRGGLDPLGPADLQPWPAPFDQPFYLVMNVAVGGNFPGVPAPETRFPAELQVDYVRVYDRRDGYPDCTPRGPGSFPWEARRTRKR